VVDFFTLTGFTAGAAAAVAPSAATYSDEKNEFDIRRVLFVTIT